MSELNIFWRVWYRLAELGHCLRCRQCKFDGIVRCQGDWPAA